MPSGWNNAGHVNAVELMVGLSDLGADISHAQANDIVRDLGADTQGARLAAPLGPRTSPTLQYLDAGETAFTTAVHEAH